MKYILVTGACGGIGSAAVKSLLDNGYGVWAVDNNEEHLMQMYKDIENCRTYICDLFLEASIDEMIKYIVCETGPINGLIHCAGFDKMAPLYLNKQKDIEALFSIHVFAAMQMCKLISKKGNSSEDGCSIILISSLSAHEGATGHTAYAAAKGAIEGFLPTAACELSGKGIRINVLVLGVVETQMSFGFISKMDENQRKNLMESYPLGLGKPEDISEMISFLIGNKSRWITGQKIFMDGGHMCRKV